LINDSGRSRSLADVTLAAEAAIWLIWAKLALALFPFQWVVKTISGRSRRDAREEDVAKISWAIKAAGRRIPLQLTCLRQAFAAAWMLQSRGFAPCLKYGVCTAPDGSFLSHAWVEVNGRAVIGHEISDHFTLLAAFPEIRTHQEPDDAFPSAPAQDEDEPRSPAAGLPLQ
jgi:hypothetical protein